jgi:hypothetical protein
MLNAKVTLIGKSNKRYRFSVCSDKTIAKCKQGVIAIIQISVCNNTLLEKVCSLYALEQFPTNLILQKEQLLCLHKTKSLAETNHVLQDLTSLE